ncbi:hypothetical protein Rcae01_00951 [Novipirellula caenicola]|uniref:DUF1127 domain-containing protein n=1 Tax=Novipirellula caenicola TaxID=1536901 RepID=A0ABP9VLF2_9BACT
MRRQAVATYVRPWNDCLRQLDAVPQGCRERLKDEGLENGEELAVQSQSRIAVAVSFFCRTNLSVDVNPRWEPNVNGRVSRRITLIRKMQRRPVPV